jgi:hypothetical protein
LPLPPVCAKISVKGGVDVKRSEYVKLVNDIAEKESEYLNAQIGKAATQPDYLAYVLAVLCSELPTMSARIAGEIIEKTGVIQIDPE